MNALLDAKNISKSFPGVKALDSVNMQIHKGEVLGLLGENGAGKSTLLKIVSGILQPDEGEINIQGKQVSIDNPKHAQELGIAIVHQELKLIPYMTVAENIFLGRFPRNKFGKVKFKKLFSDTEQLLRRFGFNLDPKAEVRSLSIASQKLLKLQKRFLSMLK